MNHNPSRSSQIPFHGLAIILCSLASCFIYTSGTAADDEVRPSWTCLPQGTVAVGRIPQGRTFAKALVGDTRLGATLFDAARVARVSQAFTKIAASDNGQWEKLTRKLASYNFDAGDWSELFAGEVGFALVLHAGKDQAPLPIGLTWIEPAGDLSTRLMAAVDKALDDFKDEKDPPRRVDIDLAGRQVIHITIPWNEPEGDQPIFDYSHFLLAKLGNRLLLANTFSAEFNASLRGADKSLDPPEETAGVEEASQMFAQFLSAHAEKGDQPHLRLFETPGLLASLPGGLPAFEVLLDPQPLLKLLDTPANEKPYRMFKALALDHVGPIAYRLSLDRNTLRGNLFVSAPAPRTGLLALLDQPGGETQPPNWVPADIIEYSHYHFDLGAAYSRIKDIVIAELGDEVRPKWAQFEGQFSQFMNADLATLLSGLGTRHMSLSLPPIKAAAARPADEAAALLGLHDRSAFVWQIKDEAPWKRILQLVAPLTGLEVVEEQGFQGLRYEHEGVELGAFVGRGYLLLGVGKDVCQGLLANLRNPPAGSTSLAASDLMRKAQELLPSEPSLNFSVSDTNRHIKMLRAALSEVLHDGVVNDPLDVDENEKQFNEFFRALIPTEDELDDTFSVGVRQIIVNQYGFIARGAQELPAP